MIFAIPAVVGLGFMIWRTLIMRSIVPLLLGLGWAMLWGFGVLFCLSSGSSLKLNAGQGTVTIDEPKFRISFLPRHRFSFPLDQVQTASINTASSGTERIVLVLRNGQFVGFTAYSDDSGQQEAAQAIRDFLATHQYRQR